jgi:hypothetical protein
MSLDAAFGFQSPDSKALAAIDSTKYPDTNKDMQQNMIRLNQFVDYIASYLQTMQKGIDKNNQDPIAQIQGMASDLLVLLGGGELLYGIDLGDLQYFLPAIGALLGFDTTTPFPINLFNAAEHFLLGYVVPLDSFGVVIEGIIDGWAQAIGIDQSWIDAINNLLDAFDGLETSVEDFLTSLESLLNIFGTDFPFIGNIWHAVTTIFSSLTLDDLGSLIDPAFKAVAPWIDELATAVNQLNAFIESLSGGVTDLQGVLNFTSLFSSINFLPSGGFHPIPALTTWIQQTLAPTNQLAILTPDASSAGVTGLVPMENLAMELIGSAIGSAQEVIDAILSVFGFPPGSGTANDVDQVFTNIYAFLGNPDLSNASMNVVTEIEKFITSMIQPTQLLLDPTSALNALNLFNIVPQNLLGFIPYSHVGDGNPNLLVNPSFNGVESIQSNTVWLWDSSAGNTSPGSAYATAASIDRQLISNAIPVSSQQKLNLSAYAKWSGLTYTGTTPVKLRVLRMLNYQHVGVDDVAAPASPPADQATWVSISGSYTVPDNTDMICLQLVIDRTASAGTVWFDDGDVHKVGTMLPTWMSGFLGGATIQDDIQSFLDAIVQTLGLTNNINNALTDIETVLKTIPNQFVLGVGGPADIGSTIQSTWDNLISGFVDSIGGTGASLADMFSIGYDVSSWASLGRMSFDILSIRNNKPIDQGLLSTSMSNFSLGRVAMQASAPTIAVTQSVSAMAFLRMAESNDKGVISWLGSGVTNITACYVIVWKVDTTTGDMTCVHVSANIVGSLSSSMNWVIYNMSPVILTQAADLYGVEICVQGSGTHSVTGTTTWIPLHPSAIPKGYAATRNSGTSNPTIGTVIPAASVTYSNNVPWVEWGITVAGQTKYPPTSNMFNNPGDTTIPIPDWANYIDVVALGAGGGGGSGGVYGIPGMNGGAAGVWATGTWARGTDFTGSGINISITVGAGGAGWTASVGGSPGTASVASIPGHTITANGGADADSGNQYGQGAGNQTYNGETYVGGGQQSAQGGWGSVPGGGGASGNDLAVGTGGNGATGAVWLVFRQS